MGQSAADSPASLFPQNVVCDEDGAGTHEAPQAGFSCQGPCLTKRLLYGEPLRRRMRVCFGGNWIADTEDVIL
jgi:hypothetical protein